MLFPDESEFQIPYSKKKTINTFSYQIIFRFKSAHTVLKGLFVVLPGLHNILRLLLIVEEQRISLGRVQKTENNLGPPWGFCSGKKFPYMMHISYLYCLPHLNLEWQHISYQEF